MFGWALGAEEFRRQFDHIPESQGKVKSLIYDMKAARFDLVIARWTAAAKEFRDEIKLKSLEIFGASAEQIELAQVRMSFARRREAIEGSPYFNSVQRRELLHQANREEAEKVALIVEHTKNRTIVGLAKGLYSSVLTGLARGFKDGKMSAQDWAEMVSGLFEENMGKAIDRVSTFMAAKFGKAFEGIIGTEGAGTLIAGMGSGLIALGAGILQGLRGGSTTSVDDFESTINSSEAVRGIVAGPTNVAIARVGDSLKEALTVTELLLERIAIGVERGGGFGGGGIPAAPLFTTGSTV